MIRSTDGYPATRWVGGHVSQTCKIMAMARTAIPSWPKSASALASIREHSSGSLVARIWSADQTARIQSGSFACMIDSRLMVGEHQSNGSLR